jgi:hypothetical protein
LSDVARSHRKQSNLKKVSGGTTGKMCRAGHRRLPCRLWRSRGDTAVNTIVNLAEGWRRPRSEKAKLAREGVKGPGHQVLIVCKSLFAGGSTGGLSRTAVAPLERLKILRQVQNPHGIKYNGTVQGLKYIWRTEGQILLGSSQILL